MADTLTQEQIDAMLSSVLSGGDTASLDTHEEKEEIKEYDSVLRRSSLRNR